PPAEGLYHTTLGSTTIPHFAPQQGAVYTRGRRTVKVAFCRRFLGSCGLRTGWACRPPEEVCKPDSVPPPRKRGQQPFVWSPGCPGDRATDPRERAGHPRPADAGLPPTRSCSGWGLPSVRPHERTWRALTSPFHPCSGREARSGLFSVALSPSRPGPPLTATLPCGVRTFLSPRRRAAARPPPARRARRRCSLAGFLTFRLPVQHALAVRTQDHLLVALDLIVELRRHVHVAPLTGAAAHGHDGDAAATGEDHLVAPSELAVDALDQLVSTTPIALDLCAEAADGVPQLLGLGVARAGERRELGLHRFESFGGVIDLIENGDELGLDDAGLFLQQLDFPLRESELL